MEIVVVMVTALLLDNWLAEARRFHPLVGFGNLATRFEIILNGLSCPALISRMSGALAWLLLVLPIPILYAILKGESAWWMLSDALVLYVALGMKSLSEHAENVFEPLAENDLVTARLRCSYLVSRDTDTLTDTQVSRAVVESVLENGHDAVIASLFWYAVGGAPLVIVHRLANTLDAMWGYKTPRFLHFGYVSARMDDLLGWPSAKVTALLYAAQGNPLLCLKNANRQSQAYKSTNGGWTMASGATALGISLGGQSSYFWTEPIFNKIGSGTSGNLWRH